MVPGTVGKLIAGMTCAGLLAVGGPAIGADLYVYELPDGSRMLSDYALNNKRYRLVRVGAQGQRLGHLAAARNSQFFRADTSAYDTLIRRAAVEHAVDFALVKAVVHVESAFNPYARSHKGALGLMQLMPETAQRYGVHDVYEPQQNIDAGVRHLRYLLDLYDNKLFMALAAYNAGERAVTRHRGIPPYQETQQYVRKVLLYKRRYSGKS